MDKRRGDVAVKLLVKQGDQSPRFGAVSSAAVGESCTYATNGATITQAGTTFGKNIALFVSTNAGGLAPQADVTSGLYGCSLGIGLSTTTFKVQILISGVAT
jgi:hypothetical protein